MFNKIKNFLNDECGAVAAEYVVSTAVSVGGLTAALKGVKDAGADKFGEIADTVRGTPSEGG